MEICIQNSKVKLSLQAKGPWTFSFPQGTWEKNCVLRVSTGWNEAVGNEDSRLAGVEDH